MTWSFLKTCYPFRNHTSQRPPRGQAQPAKQRWARLNLESLETRLAPAITIARTSAPVFYTDNSPPSNGTPMTNEYASFQITNTGAALADAWATVGNFTAASGSPLIGLAVTG